MLEQMTEIEYLAIEAHLKMCINGADNGLTQARKAAKAYPSPYTEGQLKYWNHCQRALRWSLGLAQQRYRKTQDERSKQVQQSGPDTSGGRRSSDKYPAIFGGDSPASGSDSCKPLA